MRENLEFPLRRHGMKFQKSEIDDLVHDALSSVGLPETQGKMPLSA